MPEELLIGLILVVVVLGLAVYGFVALIVRLFGGRTRSQEQRRPCAFCGNMTPSAQGRCDWCGRDLQNALAAEIGDLDALRRQLRRFADGGTLKPEVVTSLLQRVERYRSELLQPDAAPPATTGSPFAAPSAKPAPEQPVVARLVDETPQVKPTSPAPRPRTAKPVVPPTPSSGTPAPAPGPRPEPASRKPLAKRGAPPPPATAPRPQPVTAARSIPQPPTTPPAPRKSWLEMLAGFMEERNIRWGELIGGMLIVGFSAALVLSLWQTLSGIPYFPLVIFVAATSAVFGAGLYAHRRWKLESTSRGLLMIATLLVPLNFLFIALSSKDRWDPITVLAGSIALAIFAWLVRLAERVLIPSGRWLQVTAVVGGSAALLLIAWFHPEQSAGWQTAAGCLPAVIFSAAIGGYLLGSHQQPHVDAAWAAALFTLLGTAAFTLLPTLGLLISQSGGFQQVRAHLAMPVALAALPILACGLTLVGKMSRDASMAAYHTAGTTVALVGMLAMLAALGLVWPLPLGIIAIGAFNCAALVFAAFHYRTPVLHVGAIACLALVFLTGVHVGFDQSISLLSSGDDFGHTMLKLTVSARSGTALGVLFVALAAVSELLARRGLHRHGTIYVGGCGVVAVVGLLLVTVHGFERPPDADALRATILYALYGAGSLAITARWRRAELSYLGLGLLLGAAMWCLWWWQDGQFQPVWATVPAAGALLMGAIAAVLRGRRGTVPFSLRENRDSPRENRDNPRENRDSPQVGSLRVLSEHLEALRSGSLVELYRIPLLHAAEITALLALTIGLSTGWLAHQTPMPVATSVCLATLCFLLAWMYRSEVRTWVGSLLVLIGLAHTLWYNYDQWIGQPRLSLLIALLAHGTLAVVAAIALDAWTRRRSEPPLSETVARVFSKPLADTALLSTALGVPVLALEFAAGTMSTWSLALCLAWLAALWLVIAWRNRHAGLLAAHQAVLALAVLVATAAWLEHPQPWVKDLPRDLFHLQSLQAYGIALGLLSLVWIAARIALGDHHVARQLLSPRGPAVDRIIRHAVVVLQLLLVAWHLLPGIEAELLPRLRAPITLQQATGGGAWILLAVMAAVLVLTLWYRWRISMIGSLLLAATVACLVAGRFALPNQQAVASALRWGSSICFVICSFAVWQRRRLLEASHKARANVDVGPWGPRAARLTLLLTTAAPVLLLTIIAALIQLGGTSPARQATGSFFHALGPNLSYLIPLLLVMVGLVGYAVRERSAEYAFSAGLVAEMMVTLGYALYVTTTADRAFGTAEFVTLIQLATVTAAAWAAAWLALRRRLNVWREEPGAGLLMSVQLAIGAAGNVLLLAAALLTLALFSQNAQDWTEAAGSPLGWVALLSVAAAYTYRQVQAGRKLHSQMVGLLGMTVLGLLACTVQGQFPDSHWGYRTLMLGWAMFAWFIVLTTWWVATVRTLPEAHGPPQALIRAAAVWVRVAGLAALLLALKAALWHHDEQLWAAATIAVASAAGATMGVWRRREGWAFAAALGANLAASLVVWHFHSTLHFHEWWLRLIQANVIASSAVALVWLAVRKRLYQLRELTLGESPLLATQTAMAIAGNVILLTLPVVWLVLWPGGIPGWMTRMMDQLAESPGWLGLLLAAAAAAWYLRQILPGNLLHVLGGLGLGAGVLAACHAGDFSSLGGSRWDDWLPYHTLTLAWTALGMALLALGILGRNLRLAAQDDASTPHAAAGRQLVFPSPLVQSWVTAVGGLVLFLAVVNSARDPAGPWLSGWALLATSVTAGMLAVWRSQAVYVFISGLLLNVVGVIAWIAWVGPAWEPAAIATLVQTNALGLGLGSVVWTLLKLARPAAVPDLKLADRSISFSHLAARSAVGLLATVVVAAVVAHVAGTRHVVAIEQLDWIALATVAAAATLCMWDRASRLALPGLYVLALLAVAMGLCARGLLQREFCHAAAIELALFVLATTALSVVLPKLEDAWQALKIPEDHRRWPADWFPAAQAAVAAAVALLGVWISLDFAFDPITHQAFGWPSGRILAPLAAALLLPAAILIAVEARGRWREGWQQAVPILGLLILSQLGFVWLVPQREPSWVWLHRSVVLMVAAVVMTFAAGLAPARLLGETSDWIVSARKVTRLLGGLALLMLLVVLAQEGLYFDRQFGAPLEWPAILVVGLALGALIVACIACAVRPDWDPLGLDESQRQIYVYAAEALGGLIALHIWLCMPWLFTRGIIRRFWMLIVLGIAFAGAGLSELFHRRRMPVLSQPLERTARWLPLVPAIGFWFMKATTDQTWFLGHASSAMWFAMAVFYGFMAVSKRSIWLGVLAVLAGNTGIWVLLHRLDIQIYEHPQLWLIPIALAALVAEYLDHHRLDKAQSTAVRYLALTVIYVSSTADMFIAGVGHDLLTPMILMFLAVFGALAGIMLRVRSFLYLGVAFLLLDIVTMVSYAAISPGTRWIAYLCGIALGIAVLVLVGIFEKLRNDVLAAVERFKDWEG